MTLRTLELSLALLPFLLVRALRPMVLIRFGYLPTSNIGDLAQKPELYLCKRDAGMGPRRTVDFFWSSTDVCNDQLKKMWCRVIKVSPLAEPFGALARLLPGGSPHLLSWQSDSERDPDGLMSGTPPHLSFTAEEEDFGRQALIKLGIPPGKPFVCFIARDSAYKGTKSDGLPLYAQSYRNSSIQNYVPAMEEITRRGYYAVRMGAVVAERLNSSNPMILDYAATARTPFLDIYLTARCFFFVCGDAGIEQVAAIFRQPIAFVNWSALGQAFTWGDKNLILPKRVKLKEADRFLSIGETIDSGIGNFVNTRHYDQLGLELVENTSEEITSLVVEMDERLRGTWQTTEGDEESQHRFASHFQDNPFHKVVRIRIGKQFLSENREWLD